MARYPLVVSELTYKPIAITQFCPFAAYGRFLQRRSHTCKRYADVIIEKAMRAEMVERMDTQLKPILWYISRRSWMHTLGNHPDFCQTVSRIDIREVCTSLFNTVEPTNNRHIGDWSLILCRKVVPISEVGIAPRPRYARVASLPDSAQFG